MRKHLSITATIFLSFIVVTYLATPATAQPKPKPKEKAPTAKELEEMMKEGQKMMDEMDPETKKMIDSMGIKMPDLKKMPKMTDQQIQQAWEDADRIVPKKDAARIAAAQATTLTGSTMAAYIGTTHASVLSKLSPTARSKGAAITQQIRTQKKSLASSAVGLWISGKPTLALYLMGQACKDDPSNGNNLNNYAVFLTMCGAEQLALPMLDNLNRRYPRNSSVLNNIAQAWLGLGDVDKAGQYADSAIKIYTYHPQANMVKCLVEESKGNTAGAIAAARRAISNGYSLEKEQHLNKLGYKLKKEDVKWDKPIPQDALGLGKFTWPDYPMDPLSSEKLEKIWSKFKDDCNQQIEAMQAQSDKLEKIMVDKQNARMQQIIKSAQAGRFIEPLPDGAKKAMVALRYLVDDGSLGNRMSFVFPGDIDPVIKANEATIPLDKKWQTNKAALDKKYDPLIGEGKPNPLEQACKEYNDNSQQFLTAANGPLKQAYDHYLEATKKKMNNLIYYYQYTTWPEQFQLAKVRAKMAWLRMIKDQSPRFKQKGPWCNNNDKNVRSPELAQFDDINCQYESTMNMGIFTITSRCSETIGHFDFGGVNIDINDNVETGRMNGTVVIGASKGFDGPAGVEVEASAGGIVEFDNTGVTDVGAKAGVDVNVAGQHVAGIETTVTVNSGTSMNGKGILGGH